MKRIVKRTSQNELNSFRIRLKLPIINVIINNCFGIKNNVKKYRGHWEKQSTPPEKIGPVTFSFIEGGIL